MWQHLDIQNGDRRSLARAITLVENEYEGYGSFLRSLHPSANIPIIGITGPPGAGKSTLVDALLREMVEAGQRVAVICVDPSSPFNRGAILGDRIRMNEWFNHPSVYIRSLASRGHMGGLNHKIIEITELLKSAPFDHIIVETVGVGQSEIEIAGLADTTVVVVVPEAGDEIQVMKSGLMEIADIFVVNKSDRPDADNFVKDLRSMLAPAFNAQREVKVIKTIAHQGEGIQELYEAIMDHIKAKHNNEKRLWLLTEKVFEILQAERMKGISKEYITKELQKESTGDGFSLYDFAFRIGSVYNV